MASTSIKQRIEQLMKAQSYMERSSLFGGEPANELHYGTRDNGVRTPHYDRAGKADIAHAEAMKVAILKIAPDADILVDTCDEWTHLTITLK